MDFHSLSRKELQSLCKKNKIPANITNVAMADALESLEKVEGLDELVNAQQSPEKTTNAEPRTVCRTSTRRKPVNVEPESSQPLTCTRRTTRRTVAEEAERENKNVNLPETPAVPTNKRRAPAASACRKIDAQLIESGEEEKLLSQEKRNMPETPAMPSSRSKAPAASTRRKVETQKVEKSLQRAYGTRQSVRLLEKSMAELCLKEKRKVEAVKIEGLCEETREVDKEKDLLDDLLENESEKHEVQEDNKVDDHEVKDPEVVSCRNLDQLQKKESQMKHDLDEDYKSDNADILSCQNQEEPIENESEKPKVEEDNEANDHEVYGSEVVLCNQLLENEGEMNHELNKDNKGNDPEVNAGDLCQNTDQLLGSEGETKLELPKDSKGDDTEVTHCVAKLQTGYETCTNSDNTSGFDPEDDNNSSDESFVLVETSDKALDTSHETVVEKGSVVVKTENSEMMTAALETQPISVVEVPEEGSFKVVDSLTAKVTEVVGESSEMDMMEDESVFEEDDGGNYIKELYNAHGLDNDNIGNVQIMKVEIINAHESNMDKYNTDEIDVIDAQDSDVIAHDCQKSSETDKTPTSVRQESEVFRISSVDDHVVPAEDFAGAAIGIQKLDKTPNSLRKISTCQQPIFTEDKVTCGIVSSPFAANTIQGQFPRPTEATPRKSSTKKQTTAQMIILEDKINKENIDNSCKKVEPKKDQVKKIVSEEDNMLYKMSLRQLTRELKEKLQIKNNEAKNVTKVGSRPALQILPENCGLAAEPEHKN